MVRAWKVSPQYVMWHGVLILCLGIALCCLGSFMTDPRVEAFGYTVAVFLTAACLVVPVFFACVAALVRKAWRRTAFYVYFVAGVLSVACWLIFWLNRLAPLDMLVLIAGLYGLVWSLWYVGLAFHLQADPRKAALLSVLAGTTAAVGIILSTQSDLSDISAVTAVACYITWIGLQTLVTVPYVFRNLKGRTARDLLADHLLHGEQTQPS